MFLKILRSFGPDRPKKGSDHMKKELSTTAKIMTKSDNIYFDQTLRKPAKVYLHYE